MVAARVVLHFGNRKANFVGMAAALAERTALRQIPGMTPSLARLPQGCAFRERCGHADDVCLDVPEMKNDARCHHPLC